MQSYHTKAKIVKAEQFLPPLFLCADSGLRIIAAVGEKPVGLLQTQLGLYVVHAGEWVITEENGKQYPLGDDRFQALFEKEKGNVAS